MKKLSLLLILVLAVFLAQAQLRNEPCGFDRTQYKYDLPSIEQKIQTGIAKAISNRNKTNHDTLYTIPVVVHVIHNGGSENISESQVQSGIDVMNEDYGKATGTPGDGSGVDTRIRFKLARIDPNGNCTNGIVRIKSVYTNHQQSERAVLKNLSFWDNTKYLNIYVVKAIAGGTAGYSSFPGGPPEEDGFVIEHIYLGRTGTAASSMGRTATHEAGHWLGLFHTFQDGCGVDPCNDGDKVCDTPPTAAANFGCPTINSCNNDVPDVNDQIENYMDYSDDNCQNMLTAGQRDRAQGSLNAIRTVIWSDSNLVATGCDSNYVAPGTCGVSANLVTLTKNICIGNSIHFMDISLNDATSWEWSFPGGSPAFSTDQNPTIMYDSIGSFDVVLKVTNGNSTDSITRSNYITVSLPGTGNPLPIQENFDSGNYPPDQLTIVNHDGEITWQLDSNASVSGNYSISINNLDQTNYGTTDELLLPFLDFTSIDTNYIFRFKYAYARSVPIYSDELIVEASTDCGSTYNQLISKSGNSLSTGPMQSTPFIPDSSQWREVAMDLSQFKNEEYVRIRFVNVTDGGNYLYLDDIQIGDIYASAPEMKSNPVKVFPNPASGLVYVDFGTSISRNDPEKPRNICLLDLTGKTVYHSTRINASRMPIDVSDLPKGMYVLRIESADQTINKKLIIK